MKHSLQRRVTVAFTLLSAVLGGVLALLVYVAVENYEDETYPERMAADFEWLTDLVSSGRPVDLSPGREHWAGAAIPAEFSRLGPGYHSVENAGSSRHVMVGDIAGERHLLVYDDVEFENLERKMTLWLGLGWAASICFALWLATLTSNRVIQPVRDLARAVSEERMPSDLPMLSAKDEIGELARALATREEALQKFLERERLFTADVSHELRTPLTVILGAAEVVKLRASQSGDRPSQDAAERILRTAREAGSIVAAFLLLSRPPDRNLAPQLALLPLLERDIEQQRIGLGTKPVKLELRIEATPIVHGAPELVSATIGNLVRNACQYTTEGFVTVVLKPDRVIVEDSGPGLSLSLQKELLSSRMLSVQEAAHGSGRGLSIAYRIAEHLGWQVVHEQTASGGTRFTVSFARG